MNYKVKTAFTLVELLVVIAIIGILSGLIIVGMSSSTDNARVAKAQIFNASLRDSLLMSIVAEWKLDQVGVPGANQTPDSWSSNTCTLSGATLPSLQTSNCVYNNCLSFNGSTAYLDCGNNVAIGNNSFTWSFWARTSVSGSGQTVIYRAASGVNGWHGTFKIPHTSSTNALFYITDSAYSGGEIYRYINPSTNSLNTADGKWHFFVGACDRTKHIAPDVYLDGVLSNGSSGASFCDQLTTNIPAGILYIGQGDGYFNGYIDEVRLYNAAIPSSKIREQYYAGMHQLLMMGSIDNGEYRQRLNDNILYE